MKIVQRAYELGYIYYYRGYTIKELDKLALFSADKQIEYMFVQKWLRNEHNISIIIDDFTSNSKIRFDYSISKLGSQDDNPTGIFETYEEAHEKALSQALKLIKNGRSIDKF